MSRRTRIVIPEEPDDFLAREVSPQAAIDFRPLPQLEACLEELLHRWARRTLAR